MPASTVPLPDRILTREAWGARPATAVTPLALPAPELYIHHTAGSLDGGWNERWADDMRGIQRYHQDVKGWRDFAYNLAADTSGQAWEGCGVGVRGSHTRGRNSSSQAIVAIGNYDVDQPSDPLLETLSWMVAHGILAGWWRAMTGPHRDAPGAATSCCGSHLIAALPEVRREAALLVAGLPLAPTAADPPVLKLDVVDTLDAPGGGAWLLLADGGVATAGSAPFLGSPHDPEVAHHWGARRGHHLEPNRQDGYTVVATTGERYHFPTAG